MAILRVQTSYMEIFDHDRQGQIIYPEASPTFNIAAANELETPHGTLGFVTTVRVSRKDAASHNASVVYTRDWLSQTLPRMLSEGGFLDFFANMWLDPKGELPTPSATDPHEPPQAIEIELADTHAQKSAEALSHLHAVRHGFDDAKKRIEQWVYGNTSYGFKQSLGEATTLLHRLESVLECSGEFQGSFPAHVRAARKNWAELAGRQVESNRNYQYALTNLKRFSMLLRFPSLWARRPPPF